MVADDDSDYRLLVTLAVASDPGLAVVGEAAHAREVVARAEELRPDVLLLDAALPGAGSVALAGEVARVAPDTLVVLASAWPGGEPLGPEGDGLPVISKASPPSSLAGQIMGCLDSCRKPDPAAKTLAMAFPAELASVGRARRWVRGVLQGWGPDELIDSAILLTSEVVTNALMHGRSGIEVSLGRHGDRVRIAVTDSDQGLIRRRAAAPNSQSGRGVDLVESMSTGWGINRFGSGKQVWFELDLPSS